MHRGAPAISVDDEVLTGLFYVCSQGSAQWRDDLLAMKRAGLKMLNNGPVPVLGEGGRGDTLDLNATDRAVHELLDVYPEAYLLPRIPCGLVPDSWLKKNPDELVVYDDGSIEPGGLAEEKPQPSRCSSEWRMAALGIVQEFLRHVEESDYADNMLGYMICHGRSGEWVNPCPWNPWFGDYSAPSREGFRRWLKEKYESVDGLRKAWADGDVTFETAEIPPAEERLECGAFPFQRIRDPDREQRVVDWYTFYAQANADTITFFAQGAKEATGGRRLVGCFYGYLLGQAWSPLTLLEGGHLGLRRVLECPDVDFLAAPTLYTHRARGSGVSVFPVPTASVRRAGKLYIDENDIRTHRLSPRRRDFGTDTLEDTLQVQRRQLGAVFSESLASWWFDMTGGWYNDPPTMAEVERLHGIGRRLLDFDRTVPAEIAFVCDWEGAFNTDLDSGIGWNFLEGMNIELSRIGAPVHRLLIEDLDPKESYKMYVFPTSYRISEERRKLMLSIIERQRSAVLWMYAPGYIINGKKDVANISALTGFSVMERLGHFVCPARTTGLGAGELSRKVEFGSAHRFSPFFEIDAGAGEVIGISEDTGRPVLARRRMDAGWTSIYSTVGPVTSSILRALARDAGVHIYVDTDDFFNANNTLCVLHAREEGEKEIRLPARTNVYDILNDREIGSGASSVTVSLRAGETGIYFFGSRRAWEDAHPD
jgi:hypothetical protein